MLNSFFILSLILFTSVGSTTEINLLPFSRCAPQLSLSSEDNEIIKELLRGTLPSLVTGNSIVANVSVFGDMEELLALSGTPLPVVQKSTALIHSVLARSRGLSSALRNASERLTKAKGNGKTLLLCVLSDGCRLAHSGAVHLAINNNFAITPFQVGEEPESKIGWLRDLAVAREIESPPKIIVMNGGSTTNFILWTSQFVHEATHFADFELVSEWILANQLILENRGMPDDLFRAYVRLDQSGRFEVDEGFMRIFLESRAYETTWAGFANILPSPEFKAKQESQRQRVMEDIRSFQSVTQFVAARLNLSERNVFEIGERMGRSMWATINKARAAQVHRR